MSPFMRNVQKQALAEKFDRMIDKAAIDNNTIDIPNLHTSRFILKAFIRQAVYQGVNVKRLEKAFKAFNDDYIV